MSPRLLPLLSLSFLVGCQKPPEPPKPQLKAHSKWDDKTLVVTGAARVCDSIPCRVLIGLQQTVGQPMELSLRVDDGREGTSTVSFAGLAPQPLKQAKFPIKPEQLGALELETNLVKLGTLTVTLEGHEPLEIELQPIFLQVKDVFVKPEKVSFGSEVDAPERTTYFIATRPMLPARVIGPGKLARDVDFLAMETQNKTGEKKCSGYRDSNGQPATVLAFAYDSTMTLVNRRTGEVVKQEVLKAGAPECPNIAFGFAGGKTEISDARITAWVDKAATGK